MDQKLKVVNCEHVPDKRNRDSYITYAICQGLFEETIVQGIHRTKINNAPGVNLHRKFAFASTPSFSPRVKNLTFQSAIQCQTST